MTRPTRLQLSRQKGFDLQAASATTNGLTAVNVARPSKWGNPFSVKAAQEAGYIGTNKMLVDTFRNWLSGDRTDWQGVESDQRRAQITAGLSDLRGKNLACWCKPGEPCHADVLLEMANGPVCEEVRP